jgi:hypothetical protein
MLSDIGEECDDGNNSNTDHCLDTCKKASCGDGYVEIGKEECDPGAKKSEDNAYGYCRTDDCRGPYWTFVTSKTYLGNLREPNKPNEQNDQSGIDRGIKICQDLADIAGLPGTYFPWLSTGSWNPAKNFSHDGDTPYVNLGYIDTDNNNNNINFEIAENWTDLADGAINKTIRYTEKKSLSTIYISTVWTGTDSSGKPEASTSHCNNWTSPLGTFNGFYGSNKQTDSLWSSFNPAHCHFEKRLYCFRQENE